MQRGGGLPVREKGTAPSKKNHGFRRRKNRQNYFERALKENQGVGEKVVRSKKLVRRRKETRIIR